MNMYGSCDLNCLLIVRNVKYDIVYFSMTSAAETKEQKESVVSSCVEVSVFNVCGNPLD